MAEANQSALYTAVSENNSETVRLLLADPQTDVNFSSQVPVVDPIEGTVFYKPKTAFELAVENNKIDIVKLFLANPHTDVNKCYAITPFFVSVSNKNEPIMDLLLKDPRTDVNEKSPLFLSIKFKMESIFDKLIADERIDVDQALYWSVYCNQETIFDKLMANQRIDVNQGMAGGKTILHLSLITSFETRVMQKFLLDPRLDVNREDDQGETPLFDLTNKPWSANRYWALTFLLKRPDIDVNKERNDGRTPLINAILKKDTHLLKILLLDKAIYYNGSTLDVNKSDGNGATPFFHAMETNNTDAVKLLLNEKYVKVNQANNQEITPLMIAANNNCVACVRELLNWSREFFQMQTAAFLCNKDMQAPVANNIMKMMFSFLKPRLEINQTTAAGISALSLAKAQGNQGQEIVALLREAGAIDP